MKILSIWLRSLLRSLPVDDNQLAEDLTLRGIAVEGIHDLGPGNGSLFEMDITTNRVDAMNHYGIAREAAAIYVLELKPLQAPLPKAQPSATPFSVSIEAQDACGRFTARVLRNVTIQPTAAATGSQSASVARYFSLLEQKQISNAVDATNFAWLAMGQPTHAFDLDKIEGGIVVRRARKGETLKTLDSVERQLDPEDLIVADHAKPLALAGVMGGWDTMITPATTNVLVEAAWFDPVAVRRTARRQGLHTDASHRFERGADFNAAPLASAIVSAILLESGGYIEGELVDVFIPVIRNRTANRKPVALALSEVHRLLGTTIDPEGISAATVEAVLTPLGCRLVSTAVRSDSHWHAELPSWRLDLDREIDLIEEVARVYGYNRFANTLPTFAGAIRELPTTDSENTLRRTLLAAGFHEAISSTFSSTADAALSAPQPGLAVPLGNPLSEEAGILRPSLVPGMLTMIAGNLHRDVGDVRLFEVGTVFSGTTEKVDERPALAIGAAGNQPQTGPHQPPRALDFYDLKGLIEQILARFRAKFVYFDNFPAETGLTPGWLHPYRAARVAVDGLTAGWFGQLHPRLASERKLKETVLVGELYLDRLFQLPLNKPAVRDISRFQPVRRDYSLLLPNQTQWVTLDAALTALASELPELIDWQAREVFRDNKAGTTPGEYSLLLGVTFQAPDRTLRDEELQGFSQRVIEAVAQGGGRLRS
jgi:phenylalanyl-tRNA synthetase beta chain